MSAGHRPTWAPSRGQQSVTHLSQQTHRTGLTSHTKLKFRQPSQTAHTDETTRRDLKRQLEQAELEAQNRRRALQGLPTQPTVLTAEEEAETSELSRQQALRKAIELDRDSSDDEENDNDEPAASAHEDGTTNSGSEGEESEDDDYEEEDETAALLAELEKIKAERAAARLVAQQQQSATAQATREEEIAYGNPLLNLEHIMHPKTSSTNSAAPTTTLNFGVKRRWDDDVIFKNQASASTTTPSQGFVNDLTRSEFHKKFMNRYIK